MAAFSGASEDAKVTQEDEVSVLKAIYDAQIEDLRQNDPWKVWRPPELLIHLQPSKGLSGTLEINCELGFYIKMGAEYPKRCPEFKFCQVKGLSEKDQAFIMNKILHAASLHVNEVMLLDLCQIIEEYLYEKNQKVSKLSFYEEMLKTREAKKRQESTEEQKMRQEEAAEIEAEIIRRKNETKDTRNADLPKKGASETDTNNAIGAKVSLETGIDPLYRFRSCSLPPKSPNNLPNKDLNVPLKVALNEQKATDDNRFYPAVTETVLAKTASEDANALFDNDDEELHLPADSLSSRLQSEFLVLKLLGKGGFGEVIKVRNRLDDQVYAIKRITLNPESKHLNKKIKREVKLLSRLNHENVVRYFNSWIETIVSVEETISDNCASNKSTFSTNNDPINGKLSPNEFGANPTDPGVSYAEWSVSYSTPNKESGTAGQFFRRADDDSSSSGSDEEDVNGNLGAVGSSRYSQCTEDSVVFEGATPKSSHGVRKSHSSSTRTGSESTETSTDGQITENHSCRNGNENDEEKSASSAPPFVGRHEAQILYIQMEFCEKNTLRQAIDNMELSWNVRRGWTLFREILEGLNHIHSQAGMIHRDIKPGNIFLDAQDHVKIGDFGLATGGRLEELRDEDVTNLNVTIGSSETTGLTTKIGTALYAAPELLSDSIALASMKFVYSQKVDIYSTGVVLFEIFYRPLPLGMERIKIISELRQSEPCIPTDFGEEMNVKNKGRLVKLLKWMLSHDPASRPSAEEILTSDLLPPLEMQETEFHKAFQKALASGAQSKSYKWVFGEIFAQNRFPNNVQDYCFDKDCHSSQDDFSKKIPRFLVVEEVENRLSRIFRRHGAIRVSVPLLMPKNIAVTLTAQRDGVELVDKSGTVIGLPYESRFGFARFIVRNQIKRLKRFSFDKVYRENGLAAHPKEIAECSVDIVSPSQACGTTATAELMAILEEIICEFNALKDQKFVLKLNHSDLIRAICIHTGLTAEEKHDTFLELLEEECKGGSSAFGKKADQLGQQSSAGKLAPMQIRCRRIAERMGVSEQTASVLMSFVDTEESLNRIGNQFRSVLRKKNSELAASLAKEALAELEKIRLSCDNLRVDIQPVVCLNMVRRPKEYDGVMFQLEYEKTSKKRGKSVKELLATGGRYDRLVESFRKPAIEQTPPIRVAAVGASIEYEKIVGMVLNGRKHGNVTSDKDPVEVFVCSVGQKNLLREKLCLLRELWNNDLSADYLQEPVGSLEELQDHCGLMGIRNIVVLKDEGSTTGAVLLKSSDSTGKFSDRKIARADVAGCILGWRQDLIAEASKLAGDSLTGVLPISGTSGQDLNIKEGRSDTFSGSSYQSSASLGNVNVQFLETIVDRNTRKRMVLLIEAQVAHLIPKFSSKVTIELIATEMPGFVVKTFQGSLDWSTSESGFRKSASVVMGQLNKYKKPLAQLVDLLGDMLFENGHCQSEFVCNKVIVLFSYTDEVYRVILP